MMLVYLPNQSSIDAKLIGGKARNLALLQKDFTVPSWFAITTTAFHTVIDEQQQDAKSIRIYLENLECPVKLDTEIQAAASALNLTGKFLAVRSSAVGEDGQEVSFAGQLESYLYVRYEELFTAVKKVWISAYHERVRTYRREHQLNPDAMSVAVIVQEMVASEVAGVAFGADPVSGARDTVVISAVYGLGEGLVSGLLDADCFTVYNGAIHSQIALKKQAVVLNSEIGQHTKVIDLPAAKVQVSCLDDDRLKELVGIVKKINEHFGSPQDIEWALADNRFYILQARPITAMRTILPHYGKHTVWDNSNIVESYAGVTTPLTFSFIQGVYTEVYKEFCRIMGVEEELLTENENSFIMLGLVKGRVYYNLLNWYQVLSLLPGYEINARFMEQMMGVKESLEIQPSVVHSRRNPYLRVATLLVKLVMRLLTQPRDMQRFYMNLNQTFAPYESRDFTECSMEELLEIYHALEKRLLRKWHAPLVNDFYAMIFYGLLKQLIVAWEIDDKNTLQNDLLTGEGGIISTRPVENIQAMTELICQDERLKQTFLNSTAEQLLCDIELFPEFNLLFQQHLQKFGIRCANELKLETITYRDDPRLLIRLIQSYVKQGSVESGRTPKREADVRKAAEERVWSALRRRPLRRLIFRIVLRQAREKVKNRENLRFERTRLFALVRELFIAFGSNLAKAQVIENPRDVFYFTKNELFDFIQGTAATTNLKELFAIRFKEFQSYEQEQPPDRFETFGPVYQGLEAIQSSCFSNGDALIGTGCSPGKVRARVKIITNPYEADGLADHILVAERTDPGWVPLFPLAKGILVERGSLLSHSAIVAREMGIPAIVAITNLTHELVDGELVEMNGSTGVITRIKE